MIRKSTRIALEIVIALILLVTIPIAVLLWRLSVGPIELTFLTPYLEEAFERVVPQSRVEIGATELTWSSDRESIDLRARELNVLSRDTQAGVSVPEVSFELSVPQLFRGIVAPTRVEVSEATLYLVRDSEGRITLDYGGEEQAGNRTGAGISLSEFLDFASPEDESVDALGMLQSVVVRDSALFIVDKKLDHIWNFPLTHLQLGRDPDGIKGEFAFGLGEGDALANINSSFVFDRQRRSIDLAASFGDVSTAVLVQALDLPEDFQLLDTSLKGDLVASFSAAGELSHLNFEAYAGAGAIDLSEFDIGRVPFLSGRLEGRFDKESASADIDTFVLQLGDRKRKGPEISLALSMQGQPSFLAGEIDGEAQIAVDGLEIADLSGYWPKTLFHNAREWITENITQGRAHSIRSDVAFSYSEEKGLEVRKLVGGFSAEELEVHYLRPLAPVTGVAVDVTFDRDSFLFQAKEGRLGEILLTGGEMHIWNLIAAADPAIYEQSSIVVQAKGPVRRALEILDHERLDLLSGLGLDPTGSSGEAELELRFTMPLMKDLPFEEVDVSASGHLQETGIQDFFLGQDVTSGDLELEVGRSGMRVQGTAELGGIALGLDWSEVFEGDANYRSHIRAQVPFLDKAGREILGLDLDEFIEGPVAANIYLTLREDGTGDVKTAVNFQEARLKIDPVGWVKEPGVQAEGSFDLSLVGDRIVAYPSLSLNASDFTAKGKATPPSEDGGVEVLELEEVDFAGGKLRGVKVQFKDELTDVEIGAGELNAGYFLSLGKTKAEQLAHDESRESEPETFEPMMLRTRTLERIIFSDGRELHNAVLELEQVREGWNRVRMKGELPWSLRSPSVEAVLGHRSVRGNGSGNRSQSGGSQVSGNDGPSALERDTGRLEITFGPTVENGHVLKIDSNDFGAVLKLFDLSDAIFGGDLKALGKGEGPYPRFAQRIEMEAEDFILSDARTASKILAMGSLTSIEKLLANEGIPMTQMVGKVELEKGVLRSDLIRAYGGALGVTARGMVDLDGEALNITGTIVPAYSINSILGEIPILGNLLIGGEGEGVLAMTYSVGGSFAAPEVNINPLSALAPGFLRSLLAGGGGSDSGRAAATPGEWIEPRQK